MKVSPGRKRPWTLPLNNPPVVAGLAASHMQPDDDVIGIVVDGRARAYPWWIAANYHVINDSIITSDEPSGHFWSGELTGGEAGYAWFDHLPLVVTICEACAGVAAFVPTLDGAPDSPLVFTVCEGTGEDEYRATGTFTVSDLETGSHWHPLIGRAMSGPLSGHHLRRVPAFIDQWDAWLASYPTTDVALAANEMRRRPHVRNLPGVEDPDAAHTSLRMARVETPEIIDHRLPGAELVLGVADHDKGYAFAYPLERLRAEGSVRPLDIDECHYLFVLDGQYRGLVLDRSVEDHVLGGFTVTARSPLRLADAAGTEWSATGEALAGERAGQRLSIAADTYVAKWSEWSLGHPGAVILG